MSSASAGLAGSFRGSTFQSAWVRYRQASELDQAAYGVVWKPVKRFSHPGLHYQRWLRLLEFALSVDHFGSTLLVLLIKVRLKQIGMKLGYSIPAFTFGPGLTLPHYGSIVVNDKVRSGSFCRVHSAVNVGESGGRAPVLGNGVYLGPGSVLFGDIVVGDRVVVGANSVVTTDVPSDCTVVGAPGRIMAGSDIDQVFPSHIADEIRNRFGG